MSKITLTIWAAVGGCTMYEGVQAGCDAVSAYHEGNSDEGAASI